MRWVIFSEGGEFFIHSFHSFIHKGLFRIVITVKTLNCNNFTLKIQSNYITKQIFKSVKLPTIISKIYNCTEDKHTDQEYAHIKPPTTPLTHTPPHTHTPTHTHTHTPPHTHTHTHTHTPTQLQKTHALSPTNIHTYPKRTSTHTPAYPLAYPCSHPTHWCTKNTRLTLHSNQ